VSDFWSLRQLRDSELYREAYSHVSLERHLGAPSFTGPNGTATLNWTRFGRAAQDFTERDRLVVNLLRPHFDQARRNAEHLTALQATGDASRLDAFDLTPKEREVAHWLALGKTNREIALILRTRVRTVEKHMESILRKLGVENRTTAAVVLARPSGQENGTPRGTS
jgi:DNA-binding CsgD family transcriptional regulator